MLPKTGNVFAEDLPSSVLCKPKILPLKSVTLEKLEKMQKEAQDAVLEQERQEQSGGSLNPQLANGDVV